MAADLETVRHRFSPILLVGFLAVLSLEVPGGTGPIPAGAADGWEFGEHTQYVVQTRGGLATRAGGPPLKLSRTVVQRPLVAPGESVELIAEYEVSAPSETITVKETRTLMFNGQRLTAPTEKLVKVGSGTNGTREALRVSASAAPGLYVVKTTIEPQAAATRGGASSPAALPDTSTFLVEKRGGPPGPRLTPAETPLAFKLWADKPQYRIGEALTVSFEAPRNGYVTLVNVGTSGRITVLFPNDYAPDHAVKGGQTYTVPGAGDPWQLTLSGPEGVELVYAVFTTSPIRFVGANFTKGFSPINDKAETVTRDINVAIKTIPLKEKATASLEIEVTP